MADCPADRAVLNFYAGPTALPAPVVERMRADILDFRGTRLGVMEISHRAPEIESVIADTAARVRCLLGLPADFEVLFLQGGGSLQFAMIPMNFSAPGDQVDYVDTGYWARKSIAEPERAGRDVAIVASSADRAYRYVPPAASIEARPGAKYLHLVTNNTVEGTQFRALPQAGIPVIADMSSDLMTDVFDPSACDMAYAHAQKNIGIAGVTLVLVRKSLLDGIAARPRELPAILDHRTHAAHGSNYHTPPTFSLYVTWLMLGWAARPGLVVDALTAAHKTHLAHAFAEIDVSRAMAAIEKYKAAAPESPSFTAFLVYCLGRAVDEHPLMHAYRKGRKKLVIAGDVDVSTMIEKRKPDGALVPVSYVVRGANRKSLAEINDDLRQAVRSDLADDPGVSYRRRIMRLPRPARRLLWCVGSEDP